MKREIAPTIELTPWLRDRCRAPRFSRNEGTVLFVDAGYFIQQECARGFIQNGWKVAPVPLAPPEMFPARLLEAAVVHRPDFLFTVNHLGFDKGGCLTRLLEEIELPFASWFVDSPAFILLDHRVNGSAFGAAPVWEREFIPFVKGFGFAAAFHLPLAGDPRLFRSRPLGEPRGAAAFVGDSMAAPAERWRRMCRSFQGRDALIKQAADILRRARRGGYEAALVQAAAQTGVHTPPLSVKERFTLASAVVLGATRTERLMMARLLSEVGLTIYGDDGWRGAGLTNINFKPRADYYRDLPEIYRSYAVQVNLTSYQMPTAVNQRVFDVPLAGGFLVTDDQEDIHLLFDAPGETVTFANIQELPDLVKHYRGNPAEREAVSRRAAERIRREHTYRRRIESLIVRMRGMFGSINRRRNASAAIKM